MHATVPAVCGCHHQPSQRHQRAEVTQHAFDWRCSQAAERRVAQQTTALSVCCCFLLPDACCLAAYRYSAYYLLPTVYRLLRTAFCLLSTAYCLLPSAYCPLSTAYCLLPTAYCLLHAACWLLLTAYCLLLAYCPQPSALKPILSAPCPLVPVAAFCPLPSALCRLPSATKRPPCTVECLIQLLAVCQSKHSVSMYFCCLTLPLPFAGSLTRSALPVANSTVCTHDIASPSSYNLLQFSALHYPFLVVAGMGMIRLSWLGI